MDLTLSQRFKQIRDMHCYILSLKLANSAGFKLIGQSMEREGVFDFSEGKVS